MGQKGEWVRVDNPDYVPYKGDEFERIALEDSTYITRDDEYMYADDAIYIEEIDEYIAKDEHPKDVKNYLADLLEDLTSDELDALVEKYGF